MADSCDVDIKIKKDDKGTWVASCDKKLYLLSSHDRFHLKVKADGWTFDGNAAQPPINSYGTDETDASKYVNLKAPDGTTTGVWVYDPDSNFTVQNDNRSDDPPKLGIHDSKADTILEHAFLVCLKQTGTGTGTCVLDPLVKDKEL